MARKILQALREKARTDRDLEAVLKKRDLLVILIGLLLYVGLSFSAVVESQGEGCSSDIKKAKGEALKNAKLNAVERHLGVLINSKTLIVNSKIMRDIIQTRMVGSLKISRRM